MAAEIIAERANAGEPFMGLLSFSHGGVSKKDISVAKNYLTEEITPVEQAYLEELKKMGKSIKS
ncbi:hypothetical protein FACS189426_17350 [Bacteroidia bacterium]|nr:hypothetical protein FACS189426_17350 [Bacteroidia bacterium]